MGRVGTMAHKGGLARRHFGVLVVLLCMCGVCVLSVYLKDVINYTTHSLNCACSVQSVVEEEFRDHSFTTEEEEFWCGGGDIKERLRQL